MVPQSFALIVAFLLCLDYTSAVKEAFTPVAFPAVQTSVTSTAFNPGESLFHNETSIFLADGIVLQRSPIQEELQTAPVPLTSSLSAPALHTRLIAPCQSLPALSLPVQILLHRQTSQHQPISLPFLLPRPYLKLRLWLLPAV